MVTKNSIDSNIPIEISKGGTNATSFSTATGIVKYDGTSLVSSSTALIDASNRMLNASQPAFSAYTSANHANVTGDGTTYTMVFDGEFFDQNNNFNTGTYTFTAPVTGKYFLSAHALLQTTVTASTPLIQIVTTARTYIFGNYGGTFAGNFPISVSAICDMTANDTAYVQIIVSGGTKTVGTYGSAADARSIFCGNLIC